MLESFSNLHTSEIELRRQVPILVCDWLISCLLTQRGVMDAEWIGGTCRLVLKYDADLLGSAELFDFVHAQGIPVAALRTGYEQAPRHDGHGVDELSHHRHEIRV